MSGRRWYGFVAAAWAWAALARAGGLIPANFNPKTDSLGFRWDINNYGAIGQGTNYCFGNALILSVNGNQFRASQSMMTADGAEYVLSSRISNVEVTRRIRLDLKAGVVRYVEVFKNAGAAGATLNVSLQTNLNNRSQVVVSDRGTPSPASLGKKESGLVAVQQPGPRPSVLFWLAAARSKFKPIITNKHNQRLTFSYALTVKPGKQASILHGIAQRHLSGTPDAKALGAMFRPFRSRKWTAGLSREIRRTIVNLRAVGYGGSEPEPLAALESLGVSRGDTDVLALGNDTVLHGTAACERLSIKTRYGGVTVPLEKVAAVVGSGRGGAETRLYLRDGQVLCGRMDARGLRFTLNSGLAMDLTAKTAGILALRSRPDDGKVSQEARAFIETFEGDRIALGECAGLSLSALTPWGRFELSLDELRWLRPCEDDQPGSRIRLMDGSCFFAFLGGDPLTAKTLFFGVQEFRPTEIRALRPVRGETRRAREEAEIEQPHVVLVGENVLVGGVDLATVNYLAAGELVPLSPDQIRVMHNVSEEAGEDGGAVFSAEIWGGGNVTGRLTELVLPVRVGDRVCQIPTRDIVDVFVPSPAVPDSLRDRMAGLICDFGHPDWERREKASRELSGLGFLARAQLSEAVKVTTDPEVRRRAQELLDGLQ